MEDQAVVGESSPSGEEFGPVNTLVRRHRIKASCNTLSWLVRLLKQALNQVVMP